MGAGGPRDFWSTTLPASVCAALAEKYQALEIIEASPAGSARDRAIRRAASRWPGSLRESQLAGPAVCARRREAVLRAAGSPPRSRAAWCEDDPGVPLWAALHPLLGDMVAWRRALLGGAEPAPASVASFVAFTGEPPRAARWRALTELAGVGPRIAVRLAYRVLAREAGLSQVQLSYALFARRGPWERRGSDLPGPEVVGLPLEIAGFFNVA